MLGTGKYADPQLCTAIALSGLQPHLRVMSISYVLFLLSGFPWMNSGNRIKTNLDTSFQRNKLLTMSICLRKDYRVLCNWANLCIFLLFHLNWREDAWRTDRGNSAGCFPTQRIQGWFLAPMLAGSLLTVSNLSNSRGFNTLFWPLAGNCTHPGHTHIDTYT